MKVDCLQYLKDKEQPVLFVEANVPFVRGSQKFAFRIPQTKDDFCLGWYTRIVTFDDQQTQKKVPVFFYCAHTKNLAKKPISSLSLYFFFTELKGDAQDVKMILVISIFQSDCHKKRLSSSQYSGR